MASPPTKTPGDALRTPTRPPERESAAEPAGTSGRVVETLPPGMHFTDWMLSELDTLDKALGNAK